MSFPEVVDLCSDGEDGEPDFNLIPLAQNRTSMFELLKCDAPIICRETTDRSTGTAELEQGTACISDRVDLVGNGWNCTPIPPGFSKPLCRKFWKAGDYDVGLSTKTLPLNSTAGKNNLRVHPKFLHSNATSHKWAFGAIAELLDNAIDEIQNGATFVIVDKISNPRDGSPALLIQDDGAGMDPDALRRCMSFGFSEKSSKSSIGQYGNGFKTSSMRLAADAIVFTRSKGKRLWTQSVGLLSYTFLTVTGRDDIVVPMVDYEFNPSTAKVLPLLSTNNEYHMFNLSALLQWSPFASEAELLKQFDDIGHHGTKVVLYNLWLNDDGELELDFESDAEDILVRGAPKFVGSKSINKVLNQQHYAIIFRYSLRVYSSILYLRLPKTFQIILRGQVVEHHQIVNDLKFYEFILYKPQVAGEEINVVTTIGFIKEAPHVNIHGFNVYHKNRLILPFWQVTRSPGGRGRGVVGVLEANFIEPTHDKQDFEKSILYHKLESRLREMTWEYWDYHCGLIGYSQVKKARCSSSLGSKHLLPNDVASDLRAQKSHSSVLACSRHPSNEVKHKSPAAAEPYICEVRFSGKRKQPPHTETSDQVKRRAVGGVSSTNSEAGKVSKPQNYSEEQGVAVPLVEVNKKLQKQLAEYENRTNELQIKVQVLRRHLEEVNSEYERLLEEARLIGAIKAEKT